MCSEYTQKVRFREISSTHYLNWPLDMNWDRDPCRIQETLVYVVCTQMSRSHREAGFRLGMERYVYEIWDISHFHFKLNCYIFNYLLISTIKGAVLNRTQNKKLVNFLKLGWSEKKEWFTIFSFSQCLIGQELGCRTYFVLFSFLNS